MSFLLKKSQTNYNAAQILRDEGKHSAVPHCAYYSCIQLMKHILLLKGEDDDALEKTRQALKDPSTGRVLGTHEVIIKRIKHHLTDAATGVIPKKTRKLFSENLDPLKVHRTDADYLNVGISPQTGANAVVFCEQFSNGLRTTFAALFL